MNKINREGVVSVDRIRPGLICVQSQWNAVRFNREQTFQPSRFGNAVNATQFQSQFNTFKFTTLPSFGSTQPSTGISPMSGTFGGYGFGGTSLGRTKILGSTAPPANTSMKSSSGTIGNGGSTSTEVGVGLQGKPVFTSTAQGTTPPQETSPPPGSSSLSDASTDTIEIAPKCRSSSEKDEKLLSGVHQNKSLEELRFEEEAVDRKRAKKSDLKELGSTQPSEHTGSRSASSIRTTNLFGQPTPCTATPSTSVHTEQKLNPPSAAKKNLLGRTPPGLHVPLNFGFGHAVPQLQDQPSIFANLGHVTPLMSIQTSFEDQLGDEHFVDFTINEYNYILKLSFMMFKKKLMATLTLTQYEPTRKRTLEQANSTRIKMEIDEGYAGCEKDSDQQRPTHVWANLNLGNRKIHVFKRSSNYDRRWVSEKFDGASICLDEPLLCFLWMEFPTFSGGEKQALKLLTDLYVQQNHCDVEFSMEDNQKIGGHVNILATRSPVFSAMFEQDTKNENLKQVCVIQDVKPSIFKEMLHYIYSGRTRTPLTQDKAQALYLAAGKYDIEDLQEECVRSLLSFIRVDSVINLMTWSHLNSVEKLKEKALTYMADRSKEICQLDDWEKLIKYYPDLCLLASRRMMG